MDAMVMTDFGGPEVLARRDLPEPTPGPRDLLVAVAAAAVNPVDCKLRQGAIPMDRRPPIVLGFDVAGVVRAVGSEVASFREGDRVYASPALNRDGANAALCLVDERTAAPRPDRLDAAHAAALPLVTLTAWEALFGHARLAAGETVLIPGAGGGVGHVAVQLAKRTGARVIATAGRPESQQLAREAGADVVIDYHAEDVVERVRAETDGAGVPVALETVGGDHLATSIECLAVHGRLVSILGAPGDAPLSKLFFKNAALHFEFMGAANLFGVGREAQGAILRRAAGLADEGRLEPRVSATYSLDELARAHEQQETGHTLGKLAVAVA